MKGGKSKIYSNILQELKGVEGVKMLALASRDGFLIGEYPSEDKEMLTLMSATMLRAAEAVINKLEKVSPNCVIVDFNGGKLITAAAGSKALVSVMAAQDACLDPIISELERTAEKIKEIL
ncbi:MAG: roadblock/LC7 domain-containing protein [Candidatus Methanoperedens sp.]|nr:roadblock/LC7 domain-containing protein [Candidatus Methanoperedens sp.]MCZ7395797.1 roadblock/LC7 domain-containing protein [Candidatus Methanoperedens sp.]